MYVCVCVHAAHVVHTLHAGTRCIYMHCCGGETVVVVLLLAVLGDEPSIVEVTQKRLSTRTW